MNWMIPARQGIWEKRTMRLAHIRPSHGHRNNEMKWVYIKQIYREQEPRILIDQNNIIIKGHDVYDAYHTLGFVWVPVGIKIGD